jgi:flagellar motility protein MotE (MotC chaperone)
MDINRSSIVRWTLVVPALIISYFGLLLLTGSSGKPGVDMLGLGTAQERTEQERDTRGTVSEELASALRAKEAELDRREAAIAKKEQELTVWEKDLQRLRTQLNDERKVLDKDQADYTRQEQERKSQRVQQIAQTMKSVKADVAARQLVELYNQNRSTALFVILNMDSRTTGKIFSKMGDAKTAARILEDFNSWKVSQAENTDSSNQ